MSIELECQVSNRVEVLFSESNGSWQTTPPWVEFLLRVGFSWPAGSDARRIALVSMPCDSAAAGLIALGAAIRHLSNPNSNDVDGHADRLTAHAKDYLKHCDRCDLEQCDPEKKRCGLIRKLTGILRSSKLEYQGVRFFIKKLNNDPDVPIWVLADRRRGGGYDCPSRDELRTFHLDGETPLEIPKSGQGLNPADYLRLIPEATVCSENLLRSYSGLCLASRSSGASQTRAMFDKIRFSVPGERTLSDLLTIHEWGTSNVSRVCLFNSLTGRFDRGGAIPTFVVADGDASFLKVLSDHRFQHADVVGVIHRTVERERLEAIGNKIAQLSQWYTADEETLCVMPPLVRGISLSVQKRRDL